MNIVVLHVYTWDPEGTHAIAAPGLAPEERVVLWYGLPPPEAPEHPGLAPVVLAGQVDHRMAYMERLPPGGLLPRMRLPPGAIARVHDELLLAVRALHRAGLVHGAIREDRVWIGVNGEVILFGRGRWGGTPEDDIACVERVFPRTEQPMSAAALGQRVESRLSSGTVTPVLEQIALTIGLRSSEDAADEVVPDIGPDPGRDGILDRWGVNTSTSTGGSDHSEPTPEVTADGRGPTVRLHQDFWQNLANPAPVAPPERFAAVDGQPSRALRALVAEEPPEPLPGRIELPEAQVQTPDLEDVPTMVRRAAPSGAAARPGVGVPIALFLCLVAVLTFAVLLVVHSLT